MKHLLQTIANLIIWFNLSFNSFFGILWYGKLPKISMYHRANRMDFYKIKNIYNEVNSQVIRIEDVPKDVQHRIITEYINELYKNNTFKANIIDISIPIFNGKKIIGNESVNGMFLDAKVEYLKNL